MESGFYLYCPGADHNRIGLYYFDENRDQIFGLSARTKKCWYRPSSHRWKNALPIDIDCVRFTFGADILNKAKTFLLTEGLPV